MKTTQTNNFSVIRYSSNIVIRQPKKCYIPMFKYEFSKWCFSLPIKTMYLMTLEQAKETIEKRKNDPNTRGYKCEYKIAKIVNQ